MFYTYILYSAAKDKFYIGSTENPDQRLRKHNNANKGFTNQANDWKVVYLKEYNSKLEALAHERQIKNWKSRIMVRKLIEESETSERPD